jgi:hypothetical protein
MMSPAEFRKLIADETERWAKVIKFAKIKPGVRPRAPFFLCFQFFDPTGSSTFSAG